MKMIKETIEITRKGLMKGTKVMKTKRQVWEQVSKKHGTIQFLSIMVFHQVKCKATLVEQGMGLYSRTAKQLLNSLAGKEKLNEIDTFSQLNDQKREQLIKC